MVRFQVNVQFCVDQCNPVQCGDGLESFGRRRRAAEEEVHSEVPAPYASRLVFDPERGQEVISGDSQLSKEIIVQSNTKVDSFRDPRSGGELGVFVQGDYDDPSEVSSCSYLLLLLRILRQLLFLLLLLLLL